MNSARVSVVLLLLAVLVVEPLEARTLHLSSLGRRSLEANTAVNEPQTGSVFMGMMHRDHWESPLRDPQAHNFTFSERVKEATRRSGERTRSIQHKIQMLTKPHAGNSSSHPREAELLGVRSPIFAQQGEYITSLNLGTPPQPFVAILDSGSDLGWVQCKPCEECLAAPDPLFSPLKSSSYELLPCNSVFCNALPYPSPECNAKSKTCPYVYQYGDGSSTQGNFATDTITLPSTSNGGSRSISQFGFGCGTKNSGDLAGSDGIIGIGRGSFSLPSQLGPLVGNQFSFCLVGMFEATTKTSPLVIGNDSFASAAGSSWTPMVMNPFSPTFYYVEIDTIKVNDLALEGIPPTAFAIDTSGAGGTIIDTGTTITELVAEAYDILLSNVSAIVGHLPVDGSLYGFDLCWDTTSPLLAGGSTFPNITFGLKWSDFPLSKEVAYLEVDVGVRCLTFSSGDGINIIGNEHLQNMHMFVNNDYEVIGWKPTKCDDLLRY